MLASFKLLIGWRFQKGRHFRVKIGAPGAPGEKIQSARRSKGSAPWTQNLTTSLMLDPLANPDPQPHPNPDGSDLDLGALQHDSGDTLNPNGSPDIAAVDLREVKYASTTPPFEVTTKHATDLARKTTDPPHPASIPTLSQPVAAKLAIHFRNRDAAETVDLRPHHAPRFKKVGHTTLILAWLAKSAFHLSRKLAHRATLIALLSSPPSRSPAVPIKTTTTPPATTSTQQQK
jgi:hypothetical protein